MKLEDVLKPEPIIPDMPDAGSEDNFRRTIWENIKDAENQVHLYHLLMNALILHARNHPETSFLRFAEDLKLLKDTVHETEIDLGGGKKLPIRLELAVNEDLLSEHILNIMREVWSNMLGSQLNDDQKRFDHDMIANELLELETKLKEKLLIKLGIQENDLIKTHKDLIRSFTSDLKPGDISEELDPIREFRFKLLEQISNSLSEGIFYNLVHSEHDRKTGIKARFKINGGGDIYDEILELIGIKFSNRSKSKPKLSPSIVHFYAERENFDEFILENKTGHPQLLQAVLDFLFVKKKIDEGIFTHVTASFRTNTSLSSLDNFRRFYPDFVAGTYHYEKLIQSLIRETESVLTFLDFSFTDPWNERYANLRVHLPVVKLQMLEITDYNPGREEHADFMNNEAMLEGYSPLEYYSLNVGTERYLGSFDGCEHFFVSQTGLDLQLFNSSFSRKFDFFKRQVFEYKNGIFEQVKKIGRYRRTLSVMRESIRLKLHADDEFTDNFKFSQNWKGLYHLRIGGLCSGGVRNYYFEPNLIAYRTGGGYGVGRADKVVSSEYLWRCDGDDEQQRKVAAWLKLDSDRFIDSNYRVENLQPFSGFGHEFIEDTDEVRYVRVNLPYVNTVEIKDKMADETALTLLGSLDIKYYRKVDGQNRVVKEDRKNYPHSEINLPVCFAIPDNYRFLHKFRDEHGLRTNRKWLMSMQRKKAKLGSPTGLKEDLNRIKGGSSATDYARSRFSKNIFNETDIWSHIKQPFEELPTLQEWCHLHGRGDGGPDESGNLVAGSNHCNTEQAAIELAQRITTQNSATEYFLRTTAYVFQETNGYTSSSKTLNKTNTSVIASTNPTSVNSKKRKREDDTDDNPVRKKLKISSTERHTSLAAFIRYRVFRKIGRKDHKLIDYTFEGQSEFFDMNQYRIVNSIVEATLKGDDTPWES